MTNCRQILDDTPLDEMINGDCGGVLSDAAEELHEALLAMSARDLAIACHHDHRLSDEVRQAARELVGLIDAEAYSQAEQGRARDREEAAWERGWRRAGDELAMERNCAKEAELY